MKKSMLILICVLLCMFAFTAGVSAQSVLPDVQFSTSSEEQSATVIAPIGSTVSVGTLKDYYVYTFREPLSVVEDDEKDIVTYRFPAISSGRSFVRVQHPEGVTYWKYVSLKNGAQITVTQADLFMNNEKYNSDTIIDDLSEYKMDVAGVYINANAKGYMDMDVNDKFEFNVFRNWHAVEGIANSKTALPDVEYKVIDFDGNSSDVVTVVPDKNNSSVATMTANEEGTAIVLVTYDAMYSTEALRGGIGTDSPEPAFFSAIWPENTGVLVVSVGADGSSIETNMTLNGHAIDAEHDVLYYLGEDGASYTFKPENGSEVSVARAELTADSLTYNGFTDDGVTVSEDGSVTVSGLTEGSHIVKVEKDNLATYQVVCAKQTTVEFEDSEGNKITAENPANPGDTVKVQLGDIYNPVNKLSGIYNSNCAIVYTGEDDQIFNGERGSVYGYYLFASDPEVHCVEVTIPSVWADNTYSLNGYFSIGGFGASAGAHRNYSYKTGTTVQEDAFAASGSLGCLPRVDIPVKASERIAATEITLNKNSLELKIGSAELLSATILPENSTDRLYWSSSNPGIASVDKRGLVTGIKAGEAVITVTAGGVSATCSVTVLDKESINYTLTSQVAYKNEIYISTVDFSEIVIGGIDPFGKTEGIEVENGYNVMPKQGTYTIYLSPGNYETISIKLKPALAATAPWQNFVFSCNDVRSDALSTYEDHVYTTSVTPNWENNQTTLDFKLIITTANKVRANYKINLKIAEPVTGISLDQTRAKINIEETTQLTASVLPENATDNSVRWTSSNETVATVDENGTVTGLKAGTVTITATTNNGGKTATCEVAVIDPTVDAVTSLITAIGKVTLNSKDDIDAAREAYDALTEEQKSFVFNYSALVMAETKYEKLLEEPDAEDTVYFSVSRNGKYLKLQDGKYASHFPVSLESLNTIDLEEYGLESYAYDANMDGVNDITALHFLVYVHENYFGDWNEDVYITGDSGSSFIVSGLFGWPDCNLNYFVNGQYPLKPDDADRGETSDRIVLSDGDYVDIASYDSWSFHMDEGAGFHYFLKEDNTITHEYEAVVGTEFTVTLGRAGEGFGNGGSVLASEIPELYLASDGSNMPICYGTSLYAEDATKGYINENGKVSFTIDTPGTYYLWADGGYCVDAPKNGERYVVSSPAYAVVTVIDKATADQKAADKVEDLISAIGNVTKDSKTAIDSARTAYNALNADQKALVENYKVLTAAEAKYAELNKPVDKDEPSDNENPVKPDPKDEVVVVDPSELPFTDLTANWYKEAVAYVYSYGLMNGTSDTTFAPDVNLNRAMMATILYRIEGEPKVSSANPFTDVPVGKWYTDAIIWAAENGIVKGMTETTYEPLANISREQMACMMYRYAKFKGTDVSAADDLAAFADAGKVSGWADKEMKWAVEEGLINGMTKTTLVPQGTATRAQAATVLMRFNENILK